MYSTLPSFVLGFHGCDRDIGEKILRGEEGAKLSENDYDWLGNGIYFWENSPERALSYAKMLAQRKHQTRGQIKNPFVIGAVIDLGHCLNLTEENALLEVKSAHNALKTLFALSNNQLPQNQPGFQGDHDLIKRHLDCAVIRLLHQLRESDQLKPYDSVRSPFFEGGPLFEGTMFTQKAHIQIAIRHPMQCIKGYFRPLAASGRPMQ